jgi:predicted Zn-dependent protease
MDAMSRRIAMLLLVLAASPLAAGGRKGINLYSIRQEIELGRRMSAEVEKQAHVVDDPLIAEYVNRLGQNLARQADAPFP